MMDYYKEIQKIWLMVRNASPETKIGTYLELKGYKVNLASGDVDSVREILEEIADFDPDLVVLQGEQPGFDRFELCRQIKADHRLSNISVILFGTDNSLQGVVKAYRAGVHYYVAFSGEEYFWLLNLIEKLSGKRRS